MSKDSLEFNKQAKIIILGDSNVGKTSILLRFTQNTYQSNMMATMGVDMKIKTIAVDQYNIKLQIWDTAGQERFKSITPKFYKGADGIILVYSVGHEKSYQNIVNWLKQFEKEEDSKDVCKILVGSKCDLPTLKQNSSNVGGGANINQKTVVNSNNGLANASTAINSYSSPSQASSSSQQQQQQQQSKQKQQLQQQSQQSQQQQTQQKKGDVEYRKISFDRGKTLADQLNIQFIEASAKDNINIEEIFQLLGKEINKVQQYKLQSRHSFKIDDGSKKPQKRKCCQ